MGSRRGLKVAVSLALLLLPALLAPAWDNAYPVGYIRAVMRSDYLFELFALWETLSLAVIVWLFYGQETTGKSHRYALVIWLITCVFCFGFMKEATLAKRDYNAYEKAAHKIIEGKDPYQGTGYLYPPPLAQVMARGISYRPGDLLGVFMPKSGVEADKSEPGDFGVFYFYLCIQFIVLSLTFILIYLNLLDLDVGGREAALVAGVLMALNIPLMTTIVYNQINLIVLFLCLAALYFRDRSPLLAGLALVLGASLKIYPVFLCLAFLRSSRYKVLAWFCVCGAVLFFISTGLGSDYSLWYLFQDRLRRFPTQTYYNNSIDSAVISALSFFNLGPWVIPQAIKAAVAALVIYRMVVRGKLHKEICGSDSAFCGKTEKFRFWGDASDAFVLMLSVSPLVWTHVYLLAVPILMWAITTEFNKAPWKIGIAAFLILLFPQVEIFPFRYRLLTGLVMLFYFTRPRRASSQPGGRPDILTFP